MSSKIIPFILNKNIENYELVKNCFIKSLNDLYNYEDILESFDNIFFIIDENNNILTFANIEINNNIITINNLYNNIKYGKILLTYIFDNFNDDLINSKIIIRLLPNEEVIPYYLKFKYPNFPLLPPLDDKYDNDKCYQIIWNSTDEGEILYGNSDIIKEYLLKNNYNELLQLLDDYNISYDKDILDTKKIGWFKKELTKIIDDGDKEIIINYINKILKYTPVSLPKIDNYIPIRTSQRGGFIKNMKFNFVINNKKSKKNNYIFLSKIKRNKL